MTSSTYAIAIGALSCMCYMVLSGKLISRIVYLMQNYIGWAHYGIPSVSTALVFCLAMIAISGLMIRGVQQKRHRLIAPWVIIGALEVVCSILIFFISGFEQPANEVLLYIVYIVIFTLIWYPIYVLWRDMRIRSSGANGQQVNQQGQPGISALVHQPGFYAPTPVHPAVEVNQCEYSNLQEKV